MSKFLILLLSLVLFCTSASSQQYYNVLDETIHVNSTTAINGSTRNTAKVPLPQKCIGYIYRLTVDKIEGTGISQALFELLKKVPEKSISWGASLIEYAVNNTDGNAVDAFIFNNTYDADNFVAKNDGQWDACKSMLNRVNSCFASKECLGTQLYFGFRNNNIRQGLKVRLEVVAVIDTSSASVAKYSYSISNETKQSISYQLSTDNSTWQTLSLSPGYIQNLSLDQSLIYIRITTTALKWVKYELLPGNRYKIIWNTNTQKWDLVMY